MLNAYIPILLFLVVAVGFAIVLLLVAWLVRPDKYNKVKLEPYECGIETVGDARDRYSVRYYVVAMLFVIFDIETVFLFPWAVILDRVGDFRPDRDVRLPRHPHRRLLLRLAKGSARLGVVLRS